MTPSSSSAAITPIFNKEDLPTDTSTSFSGGGGAYDVCCGVGIQQERLVVGPDGNNILCDSPDPSTDLPPYAAHDNSDITPINSRENDKENEPPVLQKTNSRQPIAGNSSRRSLSNERVKPRRVIGNYTCISTLGSGSMGKVRLAVHNITGDKLAVKIVPRRQTKDKSIDSDKKREKDEHREIRTIREASIMLLLHHPFIVSLKEMVILDSYYYLFMEQVGGGQLLDYIISHGKLKEKQARRFARQIASALDYCHRNSIVHRDLKIENILISQSGNIKIIDFGLSNLFSPRSSLSTFCGSLYFAAPELLNAKSYTGPEVDVWSFGVVLYVLVCGKVPFDDQNMPALHEKIKRGVVDYPSHLSTDCKSMLSRTLMTNPAHRATVSEIIIHPWMNKGYDGPIDNYLPDRIPLSLPVDMEVVRGMTGFEFGSEIEIRDKLQNIITSEEYQKAAKILCERTAEMHRNHRQLNSNNSRSSGGASHLASRFSHHSISTKKSFVLPNDDPQSIPAAYHPLISIYYLVKERMDREKRLTARTQEEQEDQLLHQDELTSSMELSRNSQSSPTASHSLHIQDISLPEHVHPTANIVPFEQSLFGDPDMFHSPTTASGVAYGKKGKTNIRVDDEGHVIPLTSTGDKLHMIENGLGRLFSSSNHRRHSANHHHHQAEEEDEEGSNNNNVLRRLSLALSRSSTEKGSRSSSTRPRSRKSSAYGESNTVSTSTSTPIQIPSSRDYHGNLSKSYASSSTTMTPTTSKFPNSLHCTTTTSNQSQQRSNDLQQSDIEIATAAAIAAAQAAAAGNNNNATFGKKISKILPRRMTLSQSSTNAENHNNFLNLVQHGNHQQGLNEGEGRLASTKGPVSTLPSHIEDGQGDNHFSSSSRQHDHEQSFPSAADGSATFQQKGTADENIKPVFLKGLFSVTTTSTKHPSVIRADLIRVLERIGVKWRESKGRFECVHMPSIDLNHVVVQEDEEGGGRGSFSSSSEENNNRSVSPLPPPPTYGGNPTVPLPDLVVRFEIYIVKVPWLLGMHGLQFRRVGGDPWQYKNMCSKILTELKL